MIRVSLGEEFREFRFVSAQPGPMRSQKPGTHRPRLAFRNQHARSDTRGVSWGDASISVWA